MKSTYNRTLQRYVREYMEERGDGKSFTKDDLARWALTTDRIKRERGYADRLVERKLAEEFSQAMREDYGTDKRGRTVREMYAARVGGKMRWNSRHITTRGFAEVSFVQRREGAVHDCKRLKDDLDSFNEYRSSDNPIQMSFNFTNDLAELEAAEKIQQNGNEAS
jgi:hypothetical protein